MIIKTTGFVYAKMCAWTRLVFVWLNKYEEGIIIFNGFSWLKTPANLLFDRA